MQHRRRRCADKEGSDVQQLARRRAAELPPSDLLARLVRDDNFEPAAVDSLVVEPPAALCVQFAVVESTRHQHRLTFGETLRRFPV